MKNLLFFFLIGLTLVGCGSQNPKILSTSTNPHETSDQYEPFFDVVEDAPDKTYGLSETNPVKVGGFETREGPSNQRRFLSSLAGPNGEILTFHRRGSCCPYESENGYGGHALVDVYEVFYEGLKKPILVYISLYDTEKLYIPKGFTKKVH